jgi:hypothetical protein
MLNKDMKKNEKYKSSFEKLLPEPQPNSEPLLIGLPSATLAQNALLCARASSRQSSFQSFSSYINFAILKMSRQMNFVSCQAAKCTFNKSKLSNRKMNAK